MRGATGRDPGFLSGPRRTSHGRPTPRPERLVDGTVLWRLNGQIDRSGGPAIEHPNGSWQWLKQGLLHRDEDQPAVYLRPSEDEDPWFDDLQGRFGAPRQNQIWGDVETWLWFQEGRLQRQEAPAVIERGDVFEGQHYYLDGLIHREDGPAFSRDYEDGDKPRIWFREGRRDRPDGPAEEWQDGRQAWFSRGQLHRTDGPAVIAPVPWSVPTMDRFVDPGEELYFLRGQEVGRQAWLEQLGQGGSETDR